MTTEPQSKRANITAVHSVLHFVFTVPSLDDAQRFYEAFGLDVRRINDRLELRTFGHPHAWGTLVQAPGPKKLQYLSFGIYPEDEAAFKQRIEQQGLALAAHPLSDGTGGSGGMWLRGHEGLALQIKVAPKVAPSLRSRPTPVSTPAGAGAAPKRSQSGVVHPRRLSHLLMFSADVLGGVKFYSEVLGLKLSDHCGDGIAFMHGAHGSDHHLIALAKSSGPGLHHSSWDVGSVHEVGLGAEVMRGKGYTQGWGLGRHVLGSNYFHYVRDPWGSYAEYSFDIDFVPSDMDWPAADHAPEDGFYVWGPEVPADFVTNFEHAG